MKFNNWHRVGLIIGGLMIAIGMAMFVPTWASNKLAKQYLGQTMGNPVYLAQSNNIARRQSFDECIKRSHNLVDGNLACAAQAYQAFPDQNWKQIAEDNMKKGFK